MNKLVSILLSVTLLVSTIGITYNVQTCGISNRSKITFHASNDCCGSKTMPKGCCRNTLHAIKLTVDYTRALATSALTLQDSHILFCLPPVNKNTCSSDQFFISQAGLFHPPPDVGGVEYPILFCSFLI